MGERTHTPGPWAVGFSDGSGPEWITAGDDTTVVMGGDSFGTVYGVRNPADARLIAAAPDIFAALQAARQFIANGIELGFIRMPDADTPDPAHDTLPAIEAALAKASPHV